MIMPYKVSKGSGSKPYKVVHKNTGKVAASSKTASGAAKAAAAKNRGHKGYGKK